MIVNFNFGIFIDLFSFFALKFEVYYGEILVLKVVIWFFILAVIRRYCKFVVVKKK